MPWADSEIAIDEYHAPMHVRRSLDGTVPNPPSVRTVFLGAAVCVLLKLFLEVSVGKAPLETARGRHQEILERTWLEVLDEEAAPRLVSQPEHVGEQKEAIGQSSTCLQLVMAVPVAGCDDEFGRGVVQGLGMG